jgi:hypothetical protein
MEGDGQDEYGMDEVPLYGFTFDEPPAHEIHLPEVPADEQTLDPDQLRIDAINSIADPGRRSRLLRIASERAQANLNTSAAAAPAAEPQTLAQTPDERTAEQARNELIPATTSDSNEESWVEMSDERWQETMRAWRDQQDAHIRQRDAHMRERDAQMRQRDAAEQARQNTNPFSAFAQMLAGGSNVADAYQVATFQAGPTPPHAVYMDLRTPYDQDSFIMRQLRRNECPICREPLSSGVILMTPCQHVFCEACLTSHLGFEDPERPFDLCPMCRAYSPYDHVVELRVIWPRFDPRES